MGTLAWTPVFVGGRAINVRWKSRNVTLLRSTHSAAFGLTMPYMFVYRLIPSQSLANG